MRTTSRRDRPAELAIALAAVAGLVARIGGAIERGSPVGKVSQTARLIGALMDVTEMLYVGPPSWGLAVSHAVFDPLSLEAYGVS